MASLALGTLKAASCPWLKFLSFPLQPSTGLPATQISSSHPCITCRCMIAKGQIWGILEGFGLRFLPVNLDLDLASSSHESSSPLSHRSTLLRILQPYMIISGGSPSGRNNLLKFSIVVYHVPWVMKSWFDRLQEFRSGFILLSVLKDTHLT